MSKIKIFLIADGVFIAAGLILFLVFYLRRGRESGFRDDLWKEKKRQEAETRKRAFEDQVDKKILLGHKPDPADPDERTEPQFRPKEEFRLPNFHGRAHDVLGIPETAPRDLVIRAYKHWIKRYHPDRVNHLGKQYVEQARRRAEQLNTARDQMLAAAKK